MVAPFSSSYFATHSSLEGATLPPDFSKRLTWESEKLIPVQYFFRSDLQRQSIRIKTLSRAIFLLHKFNNGFFIPYTIGVSWASEVKEGLVMQGACQRAECDWGDYWFVGKALIVNVVKRAFAHRPTWAARTIYHPAGFWRQDSNLGICWVLQMCLQPSQASGLSCLQTGPLLKKSRKTTILLFVINFESYC